MKNKTALITGAAKRIGAAIAEHLHQTGMDVIIHHNTSIKEANELTDKLNKIRPDSAIAEQANLKYQESCAALINSSLKFKGSIDVLINNASVFYPTPVTTLSNKQWDEIININLKAPLFLSQLAAPSLSKNKGCIINITDIHAKRPLKDYSVYSVSKAGLIMLTESLAKELAPNVRVNAISPGAITWPEEMSDKIKHSILEHTALKKTGNMKDISKAVLFLIKDAEYITGQIINIDGGRTIY
ncbi:MAG: pteridine reductase [Proteobacteria bacterium]|nr:pteridine reductase [Pseudomonadota bacterium]NOG61053.1 pteridine reductase [Pseudomonadota bacterium]